MAKSKITEINEVTDAKNTESLPVVATGEYLLPAVIANSAVGKYALIKEPIESIREILTSNLSDEPLDVFSLDRIKVPAGGFTMWSIPTIDGEIAVKEFEAIIIADFVTRSYWKGIFGQGESGPPDCYSTDSGLTGRGDPGGKCAECPMSQFGTAQGGRGPGQACGKKRVLFLLTENDILPKILMVPAGSLKDAQKYLLRLLNARLSKQHTVTKFSLVKDKNKSGTDYAKIVFSNVANSIPTEARPAIDAYIAGMLPALQTAMARVTQVHDNDGTTEHVEQQAAA